MQTTGPDTVGYRYYHAAAFHTAAYLWPVVQRYLAAERCCRILDVGCGNGALAAELARGGYDVTGIDPSEEGIHVGRLANPALKLFVGSVYDDLAAGFGRFPAVVSLEVVEHLYAPRAFARSIFDLLEDNGIAIVSTPYHGYVKNLALALTGRLDAHFAALWDHGHIKFWSRRTLGMLLREAGFAQLRFHLVGRVPLVAKSMIVVARRPAAAARATMSTTSTT